MTLGQRCEEILSLIDEVLDGGTATAPAAPGDAHGEVAPLPAPEPNRRRPA